MWYWQSVKNEKKHFIGYFSFKYFKNFYQHMFTLHVYIPCGDLAPAHSILILLSFRSLPLLPLSLSLLPVWETSIYMLPIIFFKFCNVFIFLISLIVYTMLVQISPWFTNSNFQKYFNTYAIVFHSNN